MSSMNAILSPLHSVQNSRNRSIDTTATRLERQLGRRVFAFIFLAELAFGIWLGYRGVLLGDSVSRTANAYYVLNVRPYRFASMGLVWNPLPSALQLPFIALAKLWKPFATYGIGAAALSAFFAGWSAVILLRTFLRFRISKSWAITFSLLYALNPYLFFYGANGMSEMMSVTFTLLIITSLTLWMEHGRKFELVRIGLGFVGLFLTRYESVPFAGAVGVVMMLFILTSKRERSYVQGGKKEIYYYIEGTLLLVFLPMLYTLMIWLIYNWMITGNPLYFMNSGYSMLAYSEYYSDYGGLLRVIHYIWVRTWPFLLPLFALLLMRFVTGRILRMDTLYILLCSLVLTVFQCIMLLNGTSAGYVRYMFYPFVIVAAFLPHELQGDSIKRIRRSTAIVLAICMAFVGIFMGWALLHNEIFRQDTLLMLPEGSHQMADYINSRLSDQTILMDAYRTYYVFMLLDHPENIVISSSLDFYAALADPAAYNVDYILVPESGSYGDMDAVNIAYRSLYEHGAPWAEPEISIGEFKLYRVTDRVWCPMNVVGAR